MKKILLQFVCCLSTGLLIAQPTLNQAGIPSFGSSITTRDVDGTGISPGPAGANQSWNFTAYPDTGAPVTLTYVNPATTPFTADFPNSNYAFQSETIDGATNYGYYNLTSSSFELLGNATTNADNTTQVISLSNPQTFLSFPAALNSTNSDTYALLFANDVVSIASTGNASYLVDAYGTLTTASGTYTNVLRLKRRSASLDTITAIFGTFYSQSNSTRYEYLRVAPNASMSAWTISYDTTQSELGGETIELNVQHTTGEFPTGLEQINNATNLGIFPNPANNQVLIMLTEDAIVSVFDLGGRAVLTQDFSLSGNTMPILDVSALPSGTYITRATGKTLSSSAKLIIAH